MPKSSTSFHLKEPINKTNHVNCRAPKATRVTVPSFDDILAEAGARGQPAAANNDQTAVPDAAVAASAEKSFEGTEDDDDDLVIASEDELDGDEGAAGLAVVDLPSTEDAKAKKNKKSAFGMAGGLDFVMQDSHPLDDNFEDEVLLDDGAGTEDDSDDDSQRSWEARPDDKEAEQRDLGKTCFLSCHICLKQVAVRNHFYLVAHIERLLLCQIYCRG